MSNSAVSLILLGVMLMFGGVFYLINRSKNTPKKESKNKDTNNNINKKENDIKKEDVFNFMEFDRIQDDMIVQNKGQKYTMAIKCKGINYDLMSEVEQLAVEEGFITFLNTLKYPIQLYVQAQNIDLKGAINTYKNNISSIKSEYEERNLEYTKITEAFDSTQVEIDEASKRMEEVLNVYEYASDIISYVEKMSQNKSLLQRSFYVLISYYTSEINATEKFSKDEIINICYNELYTRAKATIGALAACSVEGSILDSNGLADLLYTAYNRDDKGLINVKDALESGFYRLYSTSKDAFMKKAEILDKKIEDDARDKAYKAIIDSVENNMYESKKMEELKIEEETSRLANEIIKRENVPEEIKTQAQNKIIEQYREYKKEIINEIKEEEKEKYAEAKKALGIEKNTNESFNETNKSINEKTNMEIKDVNSSENDSII